MFFNDLTGEIMGVHAVIIQDDLLKALKCSYDLLSQKKKPKKKKMFMAFNGPKNGYAIFKLELTFKRRNDIPLAYPLPETKKKKFYFSII